jgi:hypothetical protein
MKKLAQIIPLFILSAVVAFAQQPQTQTAPLYSTNAKYTNGVAPGYWPKAGSGLTLNVAAGTSFCGGAIQTYAGGTLTMSASTTNYVYLDPASSCAPATNTTGFTSSLIPIATVATGGSSITTITDDRTFFQQGSTVGGGMTNPMTTAGDMIVGGTSGAPTRVAAGTNGYKWTSNGPGVAPSWQASSGGGSLLLSRVSAADYGAVADGNLAANTGTDNTTAFTNCLTAAIAAKGVCYVPAGVYRIAGAMPTVSTSGTGFVGDVWGFTSSVTNGSWAAPITQIFTSSNSATILTVSGGAGKIYGNSVKNISWQRAVAPTSTATGLLFLNTPGAEVDSNTVGDSSIGMDVSYAPTYGGSKGFTNNQVTWCFTTIGIGAGPEIGYNLHGTGGGFQTLFLTGNQAFNNCGTGVTSYGFKLDGSVTDINMDVSQTSLVSYGIYASNGGQDVQITNSTLDHCFVDCIYYAGFGNSVEIRGGWATGADSGQTAVVELNGAAGVSVSDMKFYVSQAVKTIYNHGLQNGANAILNNRFFLSSTGSQAIYANAGTALNIVGNTIVGNSLTFSNPVIQFVNQDFSNIKANWLGNGAGTGISFDASSDNNCCANLNTLITFTTSDAGTGNSFTTGGTPGGSSGDIQVNNAGAFGAATSPQMVAAINNSPSSAIAPTALPDATGSTKGIVKPDGTTCTVTSGVLTCTGSSGGTTIAICADTSGSGTAQVCTTSPSFTPVAGSVIAYTTSTANAGTGLTINVNSLGAKSVAKWQGTTTLAANDILAGKYILMTYDGTNWETSTIGNAPTGGGSFQYSALPVPPAIAGFTWVNQQTGSTATQAASGVINIHLASSATLQWNFLKNSTTLPATPWRVSIYSKNLQFMTSTYGDFGLYITDGTKLMGIENLYLSGSCSFNAPACMRVEKMNSVSSDNGTVYGPNQQFGPSPAGGMYVSFCDDGATLKAQYSQDGATWLTMFSEAHATFLTATGAGVGGTMGASATGEGSLQGWSVGSVANCN